LYKIQGNYRPGLYELKVFKIWYINKCQKGQNNNDIKNNITVVSSAYVITGL